MIRARMQVRQVVGRRVRELREQAGVRQEDLATRARDFGLPWTRTRVASIERGGKPITVEDLVLLAGILSAAFGRAVDIAELFDVDNDVVLSDKAFIPARQLTEVLRGDWSGSRIFVNDLQTGATAPMSDEAERQAATVEHLLQSDPRVGQLQDLYRSLGEADERAQRTLGVELGVYLVMCHGLWGRSVAAERDARLRTHTDASPASLAARRGRVTRELLAELRDLQGQVTTAMETLGEHPAETGR